MTVKLEYFRPATCPNDLCGEVFRPKEITNYFKAYLWVGNGVVCPVCDTRIYFIDHRSKPQSKVVFEEWHMRESHSKSTQLSLEESPNEITRKKAESPKELERERCRECGWVFPSCRLRNGVCSKCEYGSKP